MLLTWLLDKHPWRRRRDERNMCPSRNRHIELLESRYNIFLSLWSQLWASDSTTTTLGWWSFRTVQRFDWVWWVWWRTCCAWLNKLKVCAAINPPLHEAPSNLMIQHRGKWWVLVRFYLRKWLLASSIFHILTPTHINSLLWSNLVMDVDINQQQSISACLISSSSC